MRLLWPCFGLGGAHGLGFGDPVGSRIEAGRCDVKKSVMSVSIAVVRT